jgi:superfamily II DNA or RNA helicase
MMLFCPLVILGRALRKRFGEKVEVFFVSMSTHIDSPKSFSGKKHQTVNLGYQ